MERFEREMPRREQRPFTPIAWIRQAICGLTGHEYLIHGNTRRMFLRCLFCAHETRGWDLDQF